MFGTVGEALDRGIRHLDVWCHFCPNTAHFGIGDYPRPTRLADLHNRFVCSACGRRYIGARPSVSDFYADLRGRGIRVGS